MKNIELYRTIESLVKFRHQNSNPTHKSFAHDYCKRQIQKKKLIPFNPKSKMNQIMKNFHQLDTYVNVEQLFDYINLLITEKKKEEGEKSMGSLRWKNSNNFIPYENRTIEKVRQRLGPYNTKRNIKQADKIGALMQILQKSSNIESLKRENHHPQGKYNYIVKQLNKNPDSASSHQKQWNFYENNIYEVQKNNDPCKSLCFNESEYLKKLKEKKERAALIHQVSTYLQIILQSQHRKKWEQQTSAHKNSKQNHLKRGSSVGLHQIKSCRNSISRAIHKNSPMKEDKNQFSAFYSTLPSSPRTKQNSPPTLKKKSSLQVSRRMKQTFTFRNRNIKRSLMNKIDNFLDYVQTEQKALKKDNIQTIAQINRLESKYRNNGGLISLPEDQQIQAVQKIVHLQK